MSSRSRSTAASACCATRLSPRHEGPISLNDRESIWGAVADLDYLDPFDPTTAAETCKAQGYRVSVTILGREGQVIVQLRGDEAPPHTIENSQKKAYGAMPYRKRCAVP